MRSVFHSYWFFLLAVLAGGALLQWVAKTVGSGFRSAERKSGQYRAGGGQGTSSKLPMTGGPAMIVTALLAGVVATRAFGLPELWKPGIAVAGFGLVGFLDDYGKYRGHGLSQKVKTASCLLAATACSFALSHVPGAPFPVLRCVVEAVFLFCFAVAADFSDGIDGLAGGLGLMNALAMTMAASVAHREGAERAFALSAMTVIAFFGFNRPSAWTSKQTAHARRATVYIGDSGAMAMGGGLAALSLWAHLGWIFIPAAALWVLEGFSSLWQAEVLTKMVYRRRGVVERYGSAWAPHVEFPLPLLAAPVHHHFEVAGWNRLAIVKTFYAFAVLCGFAAILAARFGAWLIAGTLLSLLAAIALWSLAGLFRTVFLAVGVDGRLTMNSGLPFRLGPLPYHLLVLDTQLRAVELGDDERLWLYRPMARPDGLEVLARLLAAHNSPDSARIAALLPAAASAMRLGDVTPSEEPA